MLIPRFFYPSRLRLSLTALALLGLASALPAAESMIEVEVKRRTTDKTWKPRATRTLEQLPGFDPAVVPVLNRFGGFKAESMRSEASGFFRVARQPSRWWIVDPEGYPFYAIGCCSVRPLDTRRGQTFLKERFGDEQSWATVVQKQLRDHGFNHLGCWSDAETIRRAGPMPYTVQLNLLSRFGRQLGITYQKPGHTGYSDDCPPFFHPEFSSYCRASVREQAAGLREDPWLLGYFSDNELPLRFDLLDRYLRQPAADPGRQAAEKWLTTQEISPGADGFSEEDRQAFLQIACERYYRITTEAIRAADPNHLCLGSRLHGSALRNEAVFRAAGAHLDIVAVNCYGVWTHDPDRLDQWVRWSGRPYLITEWYAKGMDSGMDNITGAGWTVKTQADRGRFYQHFTLGLLQHSGCVGWHWFKYQDNDPTSTRADPSNLNSNKGIVSNTYEPYPALLERMKALNDQAWSLIQYFDRPP